MSHNIFIVLLILMGVSFAICWGGEKIKLRDVSTLTLHQGRKTTGRRSRPVQQLQCVGGSAGCSVTQPATVQCYNRGSDGIDVQWECKAEMDNRFKFGTTEVVCEGYDYPDDPYILKGSCGLEYTLDYKSGGGSSYSNYWNSPAKPKQSGMGTLIILVVIAIVIYALYKSCISNYQHSTTDGDYPDDSSRWSFGGGRRSPPPPYPETNYFPGQAGCSQQGYGSGGSSGTTRFWQGLFTGGALGYMFGNRNQGSGSSSAYHRDYNNSRSYPSSSNYSGSGSTSSGSTSTATGYASTRRR